MIARPLSRGLSRPLLRSLINTGSFGPGELLPTLDWYPALGSFASTVGPTPAFSRASGATMIDVNGNVVWGPENLVTASENFSDAVWQVYSSSASGRSISFIADVNSRIIQGIPSCSGDITVSIELLPSDVGKQFYFAVWADGLNGLTSGKSPIKTVPASGIISHTWTNISNCTIVGLIGPGAATTLTLISSRGMQTERSSTARPYIPTTSAPVYGPRITYDPVTHECLGYLAEEQRTNLAYPSVPNTGGGLVISNLTSVAGGSDGPMGLPYRRFTPAGAGSCYIYPGSDGTSGTTYATHAWVRKVSGSVPVLNIGLNGGGPTNLITGQWVRSEHNASHSGINFFAIGGGGSWTSDLVLDVAYIQVEAGAFPTSYIPTTSAAATRSADVCQIGGADFLSFYNQSEGTIVSDFNTGNNTGTINRIYGISDVFAIWNLIDTSHASLYVFENGNQDVNMDLGIVPFGVMNKLASAYKANDFAASLNGSSAILDTSGNVPLVGTISIGSKAGNISVLNGTIARIQYFNTRLPDAKLIELTQP